MRQTGPRLPIRHHRPLPAGIALGLLLLVASSCQGRATVEAAEKVFDQYQDALFAGDLDQLRELLATESRAILPQIPLDRLRDKQRLEVVGAAIERPQILLQVEDPNRNRQRSTYVVVKERGRLVVDLIATTAFNHYERIDLDAAPTFTPRDLSSDEIARIHSQNPAAFR